MPRFHSLGLDKGRRSRDRVEDEDVPPDEQGQIRTLSAGVVIDDKSETKVAEHVGISATSRQDTAWNAYGHKKCSWMAVVVGEGS